MKCGLWVVEDITEKASYQRAEVAFGIIVKHPSNRFYAFSGFPGL